MSSSQNTTTPIDHELSIGELFGRTFDLVRQNYVRVLPIFIAFGVVSTILSSLVSYVNPSPSLPADISTITSPELSALAGKIGKYIGLSLVNYFVSWCILYFAAALGIARMNQSPVQTASETRVNYLGLAATTVLSVLIIEAGIFLLVVGALILGTMMYLTLPACALEKRYGFSAIGRSRQMVSGRWGKTFILLAGVQIIIAIFANLVGGIVGLAFSGELSTMTAVVTTNFFTALTFPLVSASMLVLYHSSRSRQEKVIERTPSPYDDMRPQPIAGFPISPRTFCPKCGSSVTQEEKFCHNCGTQLQS